jgi:hypothetical protein
MPAATPEHAQWLMADCDKGRFIIGRLDATAVDRPGLVVCLIAAADAEFGYVKHRVRSFIAQLTASLTFLKSTWKRI